MVGFLIVISLTNSEWEDLRKKAYSYAFKKGYSTESEDFAQYVCLQKFRGKKSHIWQLWIDYLRMMFGKTNARSSVIGSTKLFQKSSISFEQTNEVKNCYFQPANFDFLISPKILKPREISIIIMNVHGYSNKDIAFIYNISPSRVSVILENAIFKIRTQLKLEKKRLNL